jgi:hypothetical protein
MRRFTPTMTLRAIATMTPRRRRDTESAFEAFARLAAASGPWMLWFGMPPVPTAHDHDRDGR